VDTLHPHIIASSKQVPRFRSAMPASLPAPLLEFVTMFNRGEHWHSHEVLEPAWRENRSEFYHGLILLASALVHAKRGNAHGLAAQARKAEERLTPYRPRYLGFDVDVILAHLARCEQIARDSGLASDRTLQESLLALQLVMREELIRGDEVELRRWW
jgi:predicted metal-dependent hydrolase